MRHVPDIIHPKYPDMFLYNKDNYQNTFKPVKKTVK